MRCCFLKKLLLNEPFALTPITLDTKLFSPNFFGVLQKRGLLCEMFSKKPCYAFGMWVGKAETHNSRKVWDRGLDNIRHAARAPGCYIPC